MNRTFLKALDDHGRRNFADGQASILIIALLAGYNAWDGDTAEYAAFAKRWEAEVQSFFGENGERYGRELPTAVIEKAKELREMLGMDEL